MNLLVRSSAAPGPDGRLLAISPASAGWSYVGFEVYRLNRGVQLTPAMDGRELCAVVLSGTFDVDFVSGEWRGVGSRKTPFEGPADAAYFPPTDKPTVTARSETAEVAMCWAPAREGVERQLIKGHDVHVFTRGEGQTSRTIREILMMDRRAESLLVTEAITPGGNWSSFPPHKHDTDDPPNEAYLEETYYHRTARENGFAVQRVYTGDRSLDVALAVRDGDAVLVPRGYHPVVAEPGCDLYYLNVMAGPRRQWLVTFEPSPA